jgi:hypothetical protein
MAEIITIPVEDEQFVEKIDLDFCDAISDEFVKIPQYDSNTRWIRATVYANGELYPLTTDQIITFNARKPDTHGIDNPAGIDSEGRIVYEITEQTTNYPGTFKAEFRVYDTKVVSGVTVTKRKTPFTFKIHVTKSALSDKTIISTDEFKTLTDLIGTVGDIVTDGNEMISSLTTLKNELEEAEEARELNEDERIENESTRVAHDSTRPVWLAKSTSEYNALTQQQREDLLYFYGLTDSETSDEIVDELQNLIDSTNTARLAAEQVVISQNNINDTAINTVQTWSSYQITRNFRYRKITTTSTVSSITHNLDYSPTTDYLEVIYNGLVLDEGDNYTSSADFKTVNFSSWTIPSDKIVHFKLYKNSK